MGLKKLVKQVVTNKYNKRYQKELDSRLVRYQDWITDLEDCLTPDTIADAVPDVMSDFGSEEFVIFCNPRGREATHTREWLRNWFARYPEARILYGDEDVWPEGEERRSPYFKPDWSPDLLAGCFYPGGLVAVRRDWFEICEGELPDGLELSELSKLQDAAGLPGQCPIQDSEEIFERYRYVCQRLVCRLAELAGGYERGRGRKTILHIPHILFHNASEADREAWMQYGEAALCGTDGAADLHGVCAGAVDLAADNVLEMVSIVIPSKDNPDLLEKCIHGILETSVDLRYEIIVVDNGSSKENRGQIETLLKAVRRSGAVGLARLLYHYEPMEFDFSRMCNLGARKASGELLLFLNDDVELVEPGCLKGMAQMAVRPFTGAVGLKLLYPDAKELRQIQHAGITNLPMGPVHKLQFCRDGKVYAFGRNRGWQNVLAVTAACLMVEKAKFLEAGGFAGELPVAFNDVDLCFRLYELGYENVCRCDSFAYHDESYSRGDDEAPEKLERLLEERRRLYERHPLLEGVDPYYSVYWNREGLDTRIRPIYETQGNRVQQIKEPTSHGAAQELAAYRRDPCLMVRVESALENAGKNGLNITGWSVVLGDNNACYEKELLLWDAKTDETPDGMQTDMQKDALDDVLDAGGYYRILIQGQYRPDLVENMPDQINVGLSGYLIELLDTALPAGRYRVGILARNRVTGTKLINWSNWVVEI